MLPVLMVVGGLLALWIQSQPQAAEQQNFPNGILRAVGGMLVIGGVVAFFSQTIAFVLVGIALVLGFLTSRKD
jgi:hypothetical protein